MQITIAGAIPSIQITPEATELRQILLAKSGSISKITTGVQAVMARSVRTELVSFRTGLEKDRKEALKPFDLKRDEFNASVKMFASEPLAEEKRIDDELKAYAMAEAAEAQRQLELARKIEEEARRKAAEIEAAEKAARDKAEAEAIAAIKAAQEASKVADPFEAAEAAADLEIATQKAHELIARDAEQESVNEFNRTRELQTASQHVAALEKRAEKPITGFSMVDEIEIVDLAELYKCAPELVTLTARLNDIKAAVKSGRVLAGIKVTQKPVIR